MSTTKDEILKGLGGQQSASTGANGSNGINGQQTAPVQVSQTQQPSFQQPQAQQPQSVQSGGMTGTGNSDRLNAIRQGNYTAQDIAPQPDAAEAQRAAADARVSAEADLLRKGSKAARESNTRAAAEIEKPTTVNVKDEDNPMKRSLTYQEMDDYMKSGGMTPAEREKEEKRRKRARLWGAIGDGVSSLANLYFSTKGAYNMYKPGNSISERMQERWDKLDKERKANWQNYLNMQMQIENGKRADRRLDDLAAYRAEENERKREQDKHNAELTRERIAGQKADNDYKAARAKREQAIADAQGDLMQAQLELQQAKTASQKAAAQARLKTAEAAMIRATKSGSGGSKGSGGEYYGTLMDSDGNIVEYKTKADYDEAVARAADDEGVSKTETTASGPAGVNKTTKSRKTSDMAADVNKKREGRSSRKKNTAKGTFSIHN